MGASISISHSQNDQSPLYYTLKRCITPVYMLIKMGASISISCFQNGQSSLYNTLKDFAMDCQLLKMGASISISHSQNDQSPLYYTLKRSSTHAYHAYKIVLPK
ncbi:hypothetical protein CEXT_134821 [Caerostris extrusa]|uniref:Uncharacterized protein n=1 Tax=Caerostris extrusa TaxID=172846 RepID=A0AAV4XDL6_CAEEX|nr:hypothetical protein CEXT_134821 [Caerostris extrusa]